MKRSKQQNPNARVRRNPVLVFIIIVLITIIALGAASYLSRRPFRDSDNATPEQSTDNPSEPEKNPIEESVEIIDDNLDGPAQYEGEDPNKLNVITGSITTARVSGNVALIRVNIDQYLASGTCTIKLVSEKNKTHSETTKINAAASTSTCEGFNIPVTSLGSGTWIIDISVSSGDRKGNISGEIRI